MTLSATVTDPDGQPLAGADVTFTLSMPGIPTVTIDGTTDAERQGVVQDDDPEGCRRRPGQRHGPGLDRRLRLDPGLHGHHDRQVGRSAACGSTKTTARVAATIRDMPMWRCPHCGTPQAETARCWVCHRSSTACATCRHFRRSVAAQLGYCGLDRQRTPLRGDEIRACWEAGAAGRRGPARADRRPCRRSCAPRPDDRTPVRRLEFVEVRSTPVEARPAAPATRRARRGQERRSGDGGRRRSGRRRARARASPAAIRAAGLEPVGRRRDVRPGSPPRLAGSRPERDARASRAGRRAGRRR